MRDGRTPREYAHDVALNALSREITTLEHLDEDTPLHERRKARRALAVLHNRLLKQSGLDGMEFDPDDVEATAHNVVML